MIKKASHTALKVGLNIIALGNVNSVRSILPEDIVKVTSELLLASGAAQKSLVNKHPKPAIVKLYKLFDFIAPGQFESFAFRKAYFEKQTIDTINDGATQVLILGAGYDTMALRIAGKYPAVNFFEVDEPATAQLKIKGATLIGKPENLHFISEDLSKKQLNEVLQSNIIWNVNAKTVILAEGLLQYLPSKSVEDLFMQCSSCAGENSRFVFTYVRKDENGKYDIGKYPKLLLWILNNTKEPWLWFTNLSDLPIILENNGWRYSYELTGDNIKSGIEYLGIAEKQ